MTGYLKMYNISIKNFMIENEYDISSIKLGEALLTYFFNKYGEDYILHNKNDILYPDDIINEFENEIEINKYGMAHEFKKIKDDYMTDENKKEEMFDDYESFISDLK